MKKVAIFLAFLGLAVCLNTHSFAQAETLFYFSGGVIQGLSSSDQDVSHLVFPDEIDGEKVVEISPGDYGVAFNNPDVRDRILSVDFSNMTALRKIGRSFNGCDNITGTIVLPASLESVGRGAFTTTKLDKVLVMGKNITSISSSAFDNATKIMFNSKEIYDYYKSGTVWSVYTNQTYCYNISLVGDETLSTNITIEYNVEFGEILNSIKNLPELAKYDEITLYQSGQVVTPTTKADGTELRIEALKKVQKTFFNYVKTFTYGDEVVIGEETVNGETYRWLNSEKEELFIYTSTHNFGVLDAGDYTYILEITKEGELEEIVYEIVVEKQNISFSWPIVKEYDYIEFFDINLADNDKLEVKYYEKSPSGLTICPIKAGEIIARVFVKEEYKNNYSVTASDFDITINKSELNIVWTDTEYIYDGNVKSIRYQLDGETRGETVNPVFHVGSITSATDIGKYGVRVIGADNDNFEIVGPLNTEWIIKAIPVVIGWSMTSTTYNGQEQFPTATININNAGPIGLQVFGENDETSFVDAGDYKVIAQYSGDLSHHEIIGDLELVFTIKPITLQLVADTEDKIFNGKEQKVDIVATNVLSSDTCDIVFDNNKKFDAGNYVVTVNRVTNNNYVAPDDWSAEWSILPMSLTLEWFTNIEYNGEPRLPHAIIDREIQNTFEGTLPHIRITSETDNVNSNEDNQVAYWAFANFVDETTNFTIDNFKANYTIFRKTPTFALEEGESRIVVAYTGKYVVPKYTFDGDSEVVMKVNNEVNTTGVKEIGEYRISFETYKTQNYNPAHYIYGFECVIIIRQPNIVATNENMIVTLENNKIGINQDSHITLQELDNTEDYDLVDISDAEKYNLAKVFTVGGNINLSDNGKDLGKTTTLNIKINNLKSNKVRVFEITKDGLVEKSVIVENGYIKVSDASLGTYAVLVRKTPFFQSPAGISILCASALLIIVAVILFVVKSNTEQRLNQAITKEVNKRFNLRVKNGEQLTQAQIDEIRKEVRKEFGLEE